MAGLKCVQVKGRVAFASPLARFTPPGKAVRERRMPPTGAGFPEITFPKQGHKSPHGRPQGVTGAFLSPCPHFECRLFRITGGQTPPPPACGLAGLRAASEAAARQMSLRGHRGCSRPCEGAEPGTRKEKRMKQTTCLPLAVRAEIKVICHVKLPVLNGQVSHLRAADNIHGEV